MCTCMYVNFTHTKRKLGRTDVVARGRSKSSERKAVLTMYYYGGPPHLSDLWYTQINLYTMVHTYLYSLYLVLFTMVPPVTYTWYDRKKVQRFSFCWLVFLPSKINRKQSRPSRGRGAGGGGTSSPPLSELSALLK